MFRISSKAVYGLSAIIEIALHDHKGPIQIKEISEAQKISQHYLEQILVLLKRGNIVKSFRGAQGGYILASKPASIRVLDVLTILEGTIELVKPDLGDSRLRYLWYDLGEITRKYLNMSIAELLEDIECRKSAMNFVI